MFTYLNKTGVESDRGFVVQSIDRFTVEYREGEKKIGVYVERGFAEGNRPCVIIEPTAFEHWDGGLGCTSIPSEKQDEILVNFRDAMEFQGVSVVVPPKV